eukprot:14545037-Ditylum_brightwellii.AAC.1
MGQANLRAAAKVSSGKPMAPMPRFLKMLVTPEGHVSERRKGRAVVTPPHSTIILAVVVEAGRIAVAGHHKGAVE